jgi:TIGR03009 family protein
MRTHKFALAGVLLCGGVLTAQQPSPGAAPTLDPARNRLDALLLQWEKQMKGVQTLTAECTRRTVDKTFRTNEVFEGKAKYLKPNLAMLEMHKTGAPEVFEKFVCTGTYLYEYVPSNKVIRVHELPPPKPGQVSDDNFLSFLFGMKAEEAKRRYDLTLVKEDQYYIYIMIVPRFPADKADFQKARLVLTSNSFMPCQLWFEQPNGNEVQWDMPRLQTNPALNRQEFMAPAVPAGWSQMRVQQNPAPRVVRPQQ